MPLYGPASNATTVVSGNSQTVVAERLDGSVVILWVDPSPGGNQYDVRGKVVAANGTILVPDFLVSTSAPGNQDHLAVATRGSDGAFLAVWQNYPYPPPPGQPVAVTIQAQLFDAAGNRLGAEFSISPGGVAKIEVVPLADGGFMALWETNGARHQIKAQRLDATGNEVGNELTLYNPADFSVGTSFRLADAHQLTSGELVLSVRQQFDNIGVPSAAFVQTFDLAGTVTASPVSFGTEFPQLALAPDGGFFASYGGPGPSMIVQRLDADAEKVGGQLTVKLVNATFGTDTDLIALPDGGFLISWTGTSIAGSGEAIFVQTFTAAGVRSGPAIELATSANQDLSLVDVTTEDDGSFELTWNAGTTLMTQRFEPQAYPASGTFTGTAGNDNLIGGVGDDRLYALAGNDRLYGGTGADWLDGGTGADVTDGGPGDDFHFVDNPGDVVIELEGEGYDNLLSSISWTLAEGVYVEVLSTTDHHGTSAINLTGNSLANVIIGNDGKNVLDGGIGGADILVGGGGDDFLIVDGDDRVYEAIGGGYDNVLARTSYILTAGAAVEVLSTSNNLGSTAINLTGNEFGQILIGNAGANILDGGGGADVLQGLGGNDTYFVDADDAVLEAAGGGYDNVAARSSFVLNAGAEVEVLSTTNHGGTAAINLTGNEFANIIIGNGGANILDGGNGGADTLQGLGGNDTYFVDADDIVLEAAAGGYDNVAARMSYVLNAGAEVEVLSTTNHGGTVALNLTGNEFANIIIGNAGGNVLNGGLGADTLQGLGGADMFAFTTTLGGGNVDTILDFVSGTDKIGLAAAIFSGIGSAGNPFNANAFFAGTAAHDGDDRIIYDSATGNLYYDADGNGAGAQVLFATLQGHPAVAVSDFTVI